MYWSIFLNSNFGGDFAPPFQNFRNLVPPVFHLLLIELGSSNMICLFFIKFPPHIFVGFSKFKFCRGEFPPFSKISWFYLVILCDMFFKSGLGISFHSCICWGISDPPIFFYYFGEILPPFSQILEIWFPWFFTYF